MSARVRSGLPAFLAAILALGTGCASHQVRPWEYNPRPMADTLAIWEPEERIGSVVYEQIDYAMIRSAAGGGSEAWNADPFDGVVNSTWFTNRNGARPLSPTEIARGPHANEGPDQSGPTRVTDMKAEGVNVGFFLSAELDDPARLLGGSGRRMRHVKVRPRAAIDVAALATLIDAAYAEVKWRLEAEEAPADAR